MQQPMKKPEPKKPETLMDRIRAALVPAPAKKITDALQGKKPR